MFGGPLQCERERERRPEGIPSKSLHLTSTSLTDRVRDFRGGARDALSLHPCATQSRIVV